MSLSHKAKRQYIHSNGITPTLRIWAYYSDMSKYCCPNFFSIWLNEWFRCLMADFRSHPAKNHQSLYWSHGSVAHRELGKRISRLSFLCKLLHCSPAFRACSQRMLSSSYHCQLPWEQIGYRTGGECGGSCFRGIRTASGEMLRGQSKAIFSSHLSIMLDGAWK